MILFYTISCYIICNFMYSRRRVQGRGSPGSLRTKDINERVRVYVIYIYIYIYIYSVIHIYIYVYICIAYTLPHSTLSANSVESTSLFGRPGRLRATSFTSSIKYYHDLSCLLLPLCIVMSDNYQ